MFLREGAQINEKDKHGRTPSDLVAKYGNFKIVELLLNKGAEVGREYCTGITPLHRACEHGALEKIELFIKKGAQVNAKDNYGKITLYYVAQYVRYVDSCKAIVRTLTCKGANVNVQDRAGFSPFDVAVCTGQVKIAKTLAVYMLIADPDMRRPFNRYNLYYLLLRLNKVLLQKKLDNIQSEVRTMQNKKIEDNITLCNILKTQNDVQLVDYFRNDATRNNLNQNLGKLIKTFPIFAYEIQYKIRIGNKELLYNQAKSMVAFRNNVEGLYYTHYNGSSYRSNKATSMIREEPSSYVSGLEVGVVEQKHYIYA